LYTALFRSALCTEVNEDRSAEKDSPAGLVTLNLDVKVTILFNVKYFDTVQERAILTTAD